MNSNRKTAIIVGVLFITGTVAGILSVVFTESILGAADYLTKVSANQNQIVTGMLFVLIMAAAVVGVPFMMFPIFKKHNETLALGYVGARIIEGVGYIIVVIILLSLLTLSQEFVKAGAPDASYFQGLGTLLLAGREWAGLVGITLPFSLGALMFYYLWYRSKLIPRFISVWGLIGATLTLASVPLGMFAYGRFPTISLFLEMPLAVNEMFLAVWLIVKGFNSSAIASGSAKTDTDKV